jgi:hypothetical protein
MMSPRPKSVLVTATCTVARLAARSETGISIGTFSLSGIAST